MHPEEVPTTSLRPGQVGYVACNMKESSEGLDLPISPLQGCSCYCSAHWGYILPDRRSSRSIARFSACESDGTEITLPGENVADSRSNHQVYAGVYPVDSNDFPKLEESIKRVCRSSLGGEYSDLTKESI